jgi:hypothetical protein
VSSSLIALGLLAQVVSRLEPFVAAVLPAVFVLGEFTFAALLRNNLENLVLLRQMQRIRGYYRTLVPEADQFFGQAAEEERSSAAMATVGLRARPAGMLFTGASVIAAINSIVGGVGLACWQRRWRAWRRGPRWRSASPPRWCCSGFTCCTSSSEARPWSCGHRPRQHRLVVEVDADADQHDEDGGGDPVDDQAERRPPAGVGDIVAAVLPEVLESMAGEAQHQQPRRSGDACCGEDYKGCGDPRLDGDDPRSSVSHREAEVDRRDQGQRQRIDRGWIKPPEAER